jgi:hypothetical protein
MSETGKEKLKAYGIASSKRLATGMYASRISKGRSGSMSPLQFFSYRTCQQVWFYALQGIISMQRLPRTLRLF